MSAASSPFCRSLLAGDCERPPTDPALNRLQAGSYLSTKPGHLSAIGSAAAEAPGYQTQQRLKTGSLQSSVISPRSSGFTLLELLVVIGLITVLSGFIAGGLSAGGKTAALQSAQATMANLITAARTRAMASGQSARVLIHVDASSTSQPLRYLRYVAVQAQSAAGWQTMTETYLPEGIYVVPGNFSLIPAGLFPAGTSTRWTKADGSALRSSALRSNQITAETINGPTAEQWVRITLAATAGTMQSGDIVLAAGRPRQPGAQTAGESPVALENPENVRGLTLSSYGVPALVNNRAGF